MQRHHYLIYLLARLLAIVIKPALLYLLTKNTGLELIANQFAAVFLMVAIGMLASAFDFYRPFYLAYFGEQPAAVLIHRYLQYVTGFFTTTAVIGAAIFCVAAIYFSSLGLALATLIYFISIKVLTKLSC